MFKEAYIRDNNRIKPDDDFLASLKEIVSQEEEEEQITHIGKYSKQLLVVAASFVFLCAAVFFAGKGLLSGDGKGLKADIQSAFDKQSYQEQYEDVRGLFLQNNVVIYRAEDFDKVIEEEFLEALLKETTELSHEERDVLVGDILAESYSPIDSKKDFEAAEYYVAKFENGSYVCFVIEAKKYIYIEGIYETQSLAFVE